MIDSKLKLNKIMVLKISNEYSITEIKVNKITQLD